MTVNYSEVQCSNAGDCNDGNPCTTDSCVSQQCVHVNNTNSCDDGSFCNGSDTCSTGVCMHSGNPCPGPDGDGNCAESCNETADNCMANDPNGSACNNGLFCDGPDTCIGGACNGHSGNPCPGPDGDANCAESCNETADNCTQNDPNGSACASDGATCTSDTCSSGVCTHAANHANCNDSDACTTDSCNPSDPQANGTTGCVNVIPAAVRRVNPAATGANNGTTWADAYTNLQTALTSVCANTDLWVIAGTYEPTTGNDRTVTFQLRDGVRLYGGFAGTEGALAERKIGLNPTVLSGDLNDDDSGGFSHIIDNSYHVVTGSDTSALAVLDGFKIIGGNAYNDTFFPGGGGIACVKGSPVIRNCIMTQNRAVSGAGLNIRNPSVGGVPISPMIVNCLFYGNRATSVGGAVYNQCLSSSCSPTLVNCTIADNTANIELFLTTGGGGWSQDFSSGTGTPTFKNCIFWGNHGGNMNMQTNQIHSFQASLPAATYTDVQDGNPNDASIYAGTGNIDDDPLLIQAEYHCRDWHLGEGSPCINHGNNTGISGVDLAGLLRLVGATVDMGAYEYGNCYSAADCGDNACDGTVDNGCKWYSCGSGVCTATDRVFADMGGANCVCALDGAADTNDKFKALQCFANIDCQNNSPFNCEPINTDVAGPGLSCCPDGICDSNDAFAALNAFTGTSVCRCPLDNGTQSCSPGGEDGMSGMAAWGGDDSGSLPLTPVGLNVVARQADVIDSDVVTFDVFLADAVGDLRGYQLHLGVSGGSAGHLEMVDVRIEDRADHVFAGMEYWDAYNVSTEQMLAGLDGAGISTGDRLYLATFTYRPTGDATGDFVVDALPHSAMTPEYRTFLFASGARSIDVATTTPAVMIPASP